MSGLQNILRIVYTHVCIDIDIDIYIYIYIHIQKQILAKRYPVCKYTSIYLSIYIYICLYVKQRGTLFKNPNSIESP